MTTQARIDQWNRHAAERGHIKGVDVMSKNKPATPLPWSAPSAGVWGSSRRVCVINRKPSKDSDGVDVVRDACYIAHAANAYPRLVEALKESVTDNGAYCLTNGNTDDLRRRLQAINGGVATTLHELGEG